MDSVQSRDEIAACKLIKSLRLAQIGRTKKKWVAEKIDDFKNEQIKWFCRIAVDNKTNNITTAHGLYYKGQQFYPSKNKRLKCINKHGMETLYKKRESGRKTKIKKFHSESDMITKNHVESMDDDPESLSIDFIKSIIGTE